MFFNQSIDNKTKQLKNRIKSHNNFLKIIDSYLNLRSFRDDKEERGERRGIII